MSIRSMTRRSMPPSMVKASVGRAAAAMQAEPGEKLVGRQPTVQRTGVSGW